MTAYVVVGTGVAGISAVQELRKADPSADITLVGDDPHGFYSRPGLAYFLTGEINEKQLTIFNAHDWRRFNLRLLRQRVLRLSPREHRIECSGGGSLSYDRLLLATGSVAAALDTPGADLQGVVKLDDFEDALRIRKLARRSKAAVVIGGGIVAMELVEGLKGLGLEVHYFLRGDRYWANVLDETESRIIEQRLVHEGVRLHYQTEAAEILGRDGRVTGVRTNSGQVIPCQIVAAGIGIRPRLELARMAGLHTERGILTDEYLQTSDADIFAAGDVAQVFDPLSGQSFIDSLWNTARRQGAAAALNMAGRGQT